jgi:hypothetical protein
VAVTGGRCCRRVGREVRNGLAGVGAPEDRGDDARRWPCRVDLDGRAGAASPRLLLPRGFRADRKSWAALRRKLFRDPPNERNRVWQTDFSEFETPSGGIGASVR